MRKQDKHSLNVESDKENFPDNLEDSFDWGQTVVVKANAPKFYKPGSTGCICGKRRITSRETAVQFNQAINTELYLVEFADGHGIEIPANFLESLATQVS